jgi:hypothetical protein
MNRRRTASRGLKSKRRRMETAWRIFQKRLEPPPSDKVRPYDVERFNILEAMKRLGLSA